VEPMHAAQLWIMPGEFCRSYLSPLWDDGHAHSSPKRNCQDEAARGIATCIDDTTARLVTPATMQIGVNYYADDIFSCAD
jgi:hypothetical protein